MAPARMLNMLPKEDEEANLMYLRAHNYILSVWHQHPSGFLSGHGKRDQANNWNSVEPWER